MLAATATPTNPQGQEKRRKKIHLYRVCRLCFACIIRARGREEREGGGGDGDTTYESHLPRTRHSPTPASSVIIMFWKHRSPPLTERFAVCGKSPMRAQNLAIFLVFFVFFSSYHWKISPQLDFGIETHMKCSIHVLPWWTQTLVSWSPKWRSRKVREGDQPRRGSRIFGVAWKWIRSLLPPVCSCHFACSSASRGPK